MESTSREANRQIILDTSFKKYLNLVVCKWKWGQYSIFYEQILWKLDILPTNLEGKINSFFLCFLFAQSCKYHPANMKIQS